MFSVTPAISDFLYENRILFSFRASKARLKPGSTLTVPPDAVLEPYMTFNAGAWVTSTGAHSYTNSDFGPALSLGRHCSIGPGLRLSGFEHPMTAVTTGLLAYDRSVTQMTQAMHDAGIDQMPIARSKRRSGVTLGHDVWIGADVWLRHGITIGTGAIIAANAVVAKDVPPYTVVGGNPARVLRKRFPDEIAARFLASEWWRLSLRDLARFPITDAESFLRAYESEGGATLPAWKPRRIRLAEELQRIG